MGTHNSSQLTSNTTTTTSTTTVAKMASASVLLHTTQLEELEKDELIALVMELQNEKNALMGRLERDRWYLVIRISLFEDYIRGIVDSGGRRQANLGGTKDNEVYFV